VTDSHVVEQDLKSHARALLAEAILFAVLDVPTCLAKPSAGCSRELGRRHVRSPGASCTALSSCQSV